MKIAVYSTKQYDKKYLQHVNDAYGFELEFFDFLLTAKTAKTANGCEAVCIFVNDDGKPPGAGRAEGPRGEIYRPALRRV
ncbi:D-lactate dehydrogenase [Serratia liquefaciens]|nr:D-lactate dehydrogenase [Serratia liquefaciens]